jgi:type VII secretion integral membrane protein EccD
VTASATAEDLSPSADADARRVRIGLQVHEENIGVSIDATVPIVKQIQALVDVVEKRLEDIGKPPLTGGGSRHGDTPRGRWALCWVDGTPLRPARTLAEQGVVDGMRLWLQFVEDTEARVPVIEHVTSAIAPQLRKKWPKIGPQWAARVGVGLVSVAVGLVLVVLARWRYHHDDVLGPAAAAATALSVLVAALVVGIRSARNRRRAGDPRQLDGEQADDLAAELFVADTLMLVGAAAAAVAAALAVPGPLGAANGALGAAVLLAAAALMMRFTGRHVALGTATFVLAAAALLAGAARMLLVTSAVTLLGSFLMVALLGIKLTPANTRVLSKIKLPVFPSPSGRWIFESRPDLPLSVVVAAGEAPTLEGPESVRRVAIGVDRAHAILTGLLVSMGTIMATSAVGLCNPHTNDRWLPVVLAMTSAAGILLHARSYTDRGHATVLALLAVSVPLLVCVRYALGLWTAQAVLISCAVLLVVTSAGLAAAVVVPRHVYSPLFKQLVEWLGYVLLYAPFPLAFWVMGVYSAIRYRS